MDELRLAFRRVRSHAAATAASILTLACAIGAASTTWSLLSAVLIRPLPVRDPDRLLVLGLRAAEGRDNGVLRTGFNYPFYPYLRDSGVAGHVAALDGRDGARRLHGPGDRAAAGSVRQP